MDVFNETLHSWQNFYFMIGGAAATLAGLMFVALSLGLHLITKVTQTDLNLFATPSISYFVSTLLLAAVMLVPTYTPPALALILCLGGIAGMVKTLPHVTKLIQTARKHQDFTLADWLTQVVMPTLTYMLFLGAALCLVVNQWSIAFMGLWIAAIFLLIAAISNTWSLVMWIVDRSN
ncbi:MAG: hypothetical protein ABI947_19680 [Chloroflexota bacterium]